MILKRVSHFALLSAFFLVPVMANAHSGATGVVHERMEHMKALGASMKSLAKIASGQMPYDAAEVSKLADIFAKGSGETMIKLFPEGTNAHPSEAKAEIWQNWDKFQDLAHELKAQAEAMAASGDAQSSPQEALRANFVNLSGACKSCHTEFREKKAQ